MIIAMSRSKVYIRIKNQKECQRLHFYWSDLA
uniref:Uncharacterized protein n=1 Tax=Rhizophora mucronata TaxID=61149 RepID=A0A2P2PY59_RHIMU